MTMEGRDDGSGDAAVGVTVCPVCEARVLHRRHCKSICEHCGYVESCEDNFVPNELNPIDQGEAAGA